MKLTFEQICSVTTGAVSVEREADGIHFFRFNSEQRTFKKENYRQTQVTAFCKKCWPRRVSNCPSVPTAAP